MKSNDFNTIVSKLGQKFELKNDSGDHISYEVWYSNKFITKIKNSHSSNDYIDNLIARNLHIGRSKLREYIRCTFSNAQLIQKLKNKNLWPEEV